VGRPFRAAAAFQAARRTVKRLRAGQKAGCGPEGPPHKKLD